MSLSLALSLSLSVSLSLSLSLYIYIYIPVYVYIQRQREWDLGQDMGLAESNWRRKAAYSKASALARFMSMPCFMPSHTSWTWAIMDMGNQ